MNTTTQCRTKTFPTMGCYGNLNPCDAPRDVLRHGPTGPGSRVLATMGASSRSRLRRNKIIIRRISTVQCYFQLYSLKNWEFRTICQLATCDNRCPSTDLPPYNIITHLIKRRQSFEPVCAMGSIYETS
ncbi:hypothetical protein TNCV_4885681 [Trichonephila clavipes]|uniref:Uncharacterized protein n=1 Tax=Trichonephila clavipes TaxID=2585209 RepID=A0A8X6V5F0_TRICX|nr:hypothetical protein TNCV_4885681 [Trichonephila clavipes]